MASMYRELPPQAPPPAEFLYAVVDRERSRASGIAVLQFLLFPFATAIVLASVATPMAGLVGLVGTTASMALWARSARRGDGILFHVDGDELSVVTARTKKPRARFRLTDLQDVTLDTKTIEPLIDGASPIPGLRAATAQPLPKVNETRIVLVTTHGPLPLTEAYLASVEVTEWFGKLRVFLRKHGWVPEDERD